VTADQWRRLDAIEPSCLGCLREDVHDAEGARDALETWRRLGACLANVSARRGLMPLPEPSEEERTAEEEEHRIRMSRTVSRLRQFESPTRRSLGGGRRSGPRQSCPHCSPRREEREQIETRASRIAQNQRDRATDELLFEADGKVPASRPLSAKRGQQQPADQGM
jgi:hypothetical protein